MRAVISASRRTDLPRSFPVWLAEAMCAGQVAVPGPFGAPPRVVPLRPEDVHTVVLWSKDYRALLADEGGLRSALRRYDQLFCHFTITGLGGTPLEPEIPPWQEAVRQLPDLVRLVGRTERVSVRLDPVVHWVDGDEVRSNLPLAEAILGASAEAGLRTVTSSFMAPYGKVRRRGWRWHDPGPTERQEIGERLVELARRNGLRLLACSDPTLTAAGAEAARCIDGALLSRLHPLGVPAAVGKDKGQRPACGCTPSLDIGSYQQRCPNGCRYCYANPLAPRSAKQNGRQARES